MGKGIGGHTRAHHGATDDWITPRHIVGALGRFDLDPCACIPQPWPCADKSYTRDDDGLAQPWSGRAWLNPPYGPRAEPFLARLAEHGDGVALLFARTETAMFHKYVWPIADALLFLKGRLYFHRPDGTRASGNSGGPSVLIAYGRENASALKNSGLDGAFVPLSRPGRMTTGTTRTLDRLCRENPDSLTRMPAR
jgi:hypothetical protein